MAKEGVDYVYIIVKPILSDFKVFNGLSGYFYILSNKVAKKYLKMRNKDISEILGAFEKFSEFTKYCLNAVVLF